MFDEFFERFPPGRQFDGNTVELNPGTHSDGFADLMREHSGREFGNGLYRLHTRESSARMSEILQQALPSTAVGTTLFGYDWLGRQYGLPTSPSSAGTEATCRMFDPSDCSAFDVPVTFASFHEEELERIRGSVLQEELFDRYRAEHRLDPWLAWGRCVGLRIPLPLGGKEDYDNLEENDLEVYWSFALQIASQVANLPPGQRISGASGDTQ